MVWTRRHGKNHRVNKKRIVRVSKIEKKKETRGRTIREYNYVL